jgi:non-homologous end joining protein Ku
MNYQDNLFQKNFEMWQEYSDSYARNMMAMVEKSMATSQAFQEQMQGAVSQVVNSQFEMVMASLKSMEKQMAELTAMMNAAMPAAETKK